MKNAKHVMTIAATFLVAAATGHMMQNSNEIGARLRGDPLPGSVGAALGVTGITPVSSQPGTEGAAPRVASGGAGTSFPPVPMIRLPADLELPGMDLAADAPSGGFAHVCARAPTLSLSAAPDAFVAVEIDAPCAANSPFTLNQGAIGFTGQTDAAGKWQGAVPALGPEARIEAVFPDGLRTTAALSVPGAAALNRVALSWDADPAIGLHVFEAGATVAQTGHVSATAPRVAGTTLGGYLTVLGDEEAPAPRFAQIYSAPAGLAEIALEFVAPVNEATCGTDLEAVSQRSLGGRGEDPVAIRVAMPDCDAIGDAVVMRLPALPLVFAARD